MNARNNLIQAVKDQKVEDEAEQAREEIEFVKLAKKFRHHYHDSEIRKDIYRPMECTICEALQLVETGRDEVHDALDEKNEDYSYDNLTDVPF